MSLNPIFLMELLSYNKLFHHNQIISRLAYACHIMSFYLESIVLYLDVLFAR